MTVIAELDTEFLHNFLDDILNADFIDDVVNNAFVNGVTDCVEQTKTLDSNDEPVMYDAVESIKCRKRKLSKAETKDCKKSSIRSQSPNIDILKRAVERLKNAKKSSDKFDEIYTADSETINSSNGPTALVETTARQEINHTHPSEKLIRPSQIDDQPHLQKIVRDILKGFKVMIIMRGPPGCGKSFLAREIIDRTTNDCHTDHIFSACDFFRNQNGYYEFKGIHVGRSHQWNQEHVISYACNGWSPIIIDNTNIKKWEIDVYVKIAVQYGYMIEIVHPNTPWSKSVDELVAMNIHDVPKGTIQRMMLSYESTTVEDLMKSNDLKYTMKMPQYRYLPTLL